MNNLLEKFNPDHRDFHASQVNDSFNAQKNMISNTQSSSSQKCNSQKRNDESKVQSSFKIMSGVQQNSKDGKDASKQLKNDQIAYTQNLSQMVPQQKCLSNVAQAKRSSVQNYPSKNINNQLINISHSPLAQNDFSLNMSGIADLSILNSSHQVFSMAVNSAKKKPIQSKQKQINPVPNTAGRATQVHNQTAKQPLSYTNNQIQIPVPQNIPGYENLSASQQKKLQLKKLEEEYCKTLEQVCSPNSSTLNLENLKKTQSLHYMKSPSGADSPKQAAKSRSSLGQHGPTGAYNNLYNSQQRPNFISKNSGGRAKTASRKKRNLYTSMGNYYSGNGQNLQGSATGSKRMNNNFFEHMDKSNMQIFANSAKKRNKNNNKSYNNDQYENPVDISSYLNNLNYNNNVGGATNKSMAIESAHYQNHSAIGKLYDNSFTNGALSSAKGQAKRPQSTQKIQSNIPKQVKKKASQIRKSANQSAYGMIGQNFGQNAYDFLANTNIALFTSKPKQKNSGLDSRTSNKDQHPISNSVVKNTQPLINPSNPLPFNNTSSTTITSNRRQGHQGEILSAKKHSHQQYQQPLANDSNIIEVSSDRQTFKMHDFLKQVDQSNNNDKFEKLQQNQMTNQYKMQIKIADQLSQNLERDLKFIKTQRVASPDVMESPHEDVEQLSEAQGQQEQQLNLLSEAIHQLNQTMHPSVGNALNKIREGYEDLLNQVIENLASQIEYLHQENVQVNTKNQKLDLKNEKLLEQLSEQERLLQQKQQEQQNYAKQNEGLRQELNRVYEENKKIKLNLKEQESAMKQTQKDLDKFKMIMQEQREAQNQNKIFNYREQQEQPQQQNKLKIPKLDLGKLASPVNPALDQAIMLNPGESLGLESNQASQQQFDEMQSHHDDGQPFDVTHSKISYHDSIELDDEIQKINNKEYLAQDKSPNSKPFIPLLNLGGIQNKNEKQNAQPSTQQKAAPQVQNQKFKLDLSGVSKPKAEEPPSPQQNNVVNDYNPNQKPAMKGGLGLNLGALKQNNNIQDFQDEFLSKFDEYSQSWRDAYHRERRF